MKKKRTGTMLYPHIIKLCDDNLLISKSTSRNNFIENAIKHYVGYLHKDDNTYYLNKVINETITSKFDLLEEQFSTVFFKLIVEISILTSIIGATTNVDSNTLEKLRLKATKEVKLTVGKIDLKEIFQSYSMKEGD